MDEKISTPVQKPNSVRCVVCGKDRYTNPQVMQRRIEKFGSEEKMRAEYVCMECRKRR